jgi:hypothetical protein
MKSGSTGTRTQDQRIKKASPDEADQDPSSKPPGLDDEERREETPAGQSVGNPERNFDPLTTLNRLTAALERASAAGAWDAVAGLTAEVKAWRETNAGVVSLEVARHRRRPGA